MSEAQAQALAKARAAAMAANAAKKQDNNPDIAFMFAEIFKRLDDMTIILKDIYNNTPVRLKTDWLK